uniref:Retrotransposon gag domain-containing protein n=1 Tax=Nicotiana tabacum TaxID=4097 RepID=A0A1S4AW42_TOBAC|nr:PREDICTED: uncharacterized protein LOC107801914 [Nicotiana tabacum]
MLEKPTQGDVEDMIPTKIVAATDEPSATRTGNTRIVTNVGDNALTSILKKMEEMENENKILRDQMKEHQERVDKIPGAPKLLPKCDVGRFVEQPYSEGVAPHPIPKTFKMLPYLKIYDGTTDREDHLIHYVIAVKGNDLSKEQVPFVLLKKFDETLTGGALTWHSQLPARSISTFEEMADKFAIAHAGAKKAEARVNDIFVIQQMTGEGLRDFLTHEIPPTTWEEIHNAYYAEVRADEDDLNGSLQRLISVQTEARRDRRNNGRRGQPPHFNRERHQPYICTSNPPPPRHAHVMPRHKAPIRNERGIPLLLSAHNFCVSPLEIVYTLEKLGTNVQWPQKIKSDPSTRRSNVLCEFHQERGHKIEDCIGLRQEIVRMLNHGYLKELLSNNGRANFARVRDPSQGPPKPP